MQVPGILELMELLDELLYQTIRLYQFNRLLGPDFPQRLPPHHINAGIRQAVRFAERFLGETLHWQTAHDSRIRQIVSSESARTHELHSWLERLNTEQFALHARAAQLRKVVGF
jgi:hypothetical protein